MGFEPTISTVTGWQPRPGVTRIAPFQVPGLSHHPE